MRSSLAMKAPDRSVVSVTSRANAAVHVARAAAVASAGVVLAVVPVEANGVADRRAAAVQVLAVVPVKVEAFSGMIGGMTAVNGLKRPRPCRN